MKIDEWKPVDVSDVMCAFPASVLHLMPSMEDIPVEFRRHSGRNKWVQAQADWFFFGLKDPKVAVKPGIDAEAAWRHLSCVQGSFEPEHEHKEAAVAYLMSLWFEDISYTKGARPSLSSEPSP